MIARPSLRAFLTALLITSFVLVGAASDGLAQKKGGVLKIGNLGRNGHQAVPVLENLLRSPDDNLANQAARSLAQIGQPSVSALASAAKDGDSTTSLRALWALSLIGPEAKEALPVLVKLLDHPHERIKAGALYALGEMGPAANTATDAIVRAMRTSSALVRYQAVLAQGKIGTVALSDLRNLLQDELPEVRADAACALSLFGKHAREAVPELEVALKDRTAAVRAMAAFALGCMAKDANGSLPQIVPLLYDEEYEVQQAAFSATLSVGAGDPRMVQALREANMKGKWATPFILKQFGKNPADAVAPLIKTLQGKDAGDRLGAAWALGQIGLPARDAVPALRKALNDPQPQLRMVAWNSLKQINQEVLEDESPFLREWNRAMEQQIQAAALLQGKLRENRFEISLKDPTTQRFYDNMTQLYVAASLAKNVRLQAEVYHVFLQAGPEAIPALVRGVNLIAKLRIGFC